MSMYTLETILKKWKHGDLTAEQAIGQILQHLQALSTRVGQLEQRQQARDRPSGYGRDA